MPDRDIDEIVDRVVKELQRTHFIGREEHYQDHLWVRTKMEKEQSNCSRRQQIVDKIVGSVGVVTTLGFLGWVGSSMIQFLQEMLGRGGPP